MANEFKKQNTMIAGAKGTRANDDWSPEARKAAAEARKSGTSNKPQSGRNPILRRVTMVKDALEVRNCLS